MKGMCGTLDYSVEELITALKLMASGAIWHRHISKICIAHCHCAPFSQELMAALKVKRSGTHGTVEALLGSAMSSRVSPASCHCPAFSRQETSELKLTKLGQSLAVGISWKSCTASCHWAAFSNLTLQVPVPKNVDVSGCSFFSVYCILLCHLGFYGQS